MERKNTTVENTLDSLGAIQIQAIQTFKITNRTKLPVEIPWNEEKGKKLSFVFTFGTLHYYHYT